MANVSACAHCGLPAPAGSSGAPSFCCAGCQTVWALLHEVGLADYYGLRERIEGDALVPGQTRAERAAESPAFAYLDDPQVQAALSNAEPGHVEPGRAELHVVGLHCAACVWLIERLPAVLPGVRTARVAWRETSTARLLVEWEPAQIQLSAIAAFLHRAGYEVHAIDAHAEQAERRERSRELARIAVAGASAGNVMLVSIALYAGALQDMDAGWLRFFEWAALLLALPALTWAALPFYRAAWSGLRMGRLHIDLPIALGLIGGFAASVVATISQRGEVYFDSVSALVFLLLVGRWVQRRGQRWALSRTDLLQRLLPARARRIASDRTLEEVAALALAPGQTIEVRAGEGIPADARVIAGHGSIDASSLTGESLPLAVEIGDHVLAGTRNLHGRLELIVEAVGDQTRIGSLAARIMQADRSRAPIQRSVDRISAYFVAAVLVLAIVGGLGWWWVAPERAFGVVVALLVVSCPCALGLATPIALALARARAAERGILFGSAAAIEALASAQTAVFDKTGTLTEGELRVVEVALADQADVDAAAIARTLRAVEAQTGHPIGQALRRWAAREGDHATDHATSITAIVDHPGLGRSATIDGAKVRVGSVAWLNADLPRALGRVLERALARGETAVLIERDASVIALLSLADTPRSDAKPALARLRRLGLHLAIRSGDHPQTVAALAESLAIPDQRGACSPEAKAEQIAAASSSSSSSSSWPKGAIVMIGDGVNDAPAMRAASVGVAVRGGAEVALRVADVHLARPGLSEVAELFEGARRTMRVVHRNLGFSLIYNLVFASLALAGRIDPLMAALLMPASSLTVLLSSSLAHTFSIVTTANSLVAPAKLARQSLHEAGSVRAARSP